MAEHLPAPDSDESTLEVAQRHVAVGKSLIAEQKAIIERLRADGHPTEAAQRLLATLEQTLSVMYEHLAYEQSRALPAS